MLKPALLLKKKTNLQFLIMILLSIGIISLNRETKNYLSNFTLQTLYAPFFGITDKVRDLYSVYEQNKILRKNLVELTLQNNRLVESQLENERLRLLLNFKTQFSYRVIPAEVLLEDPSSKSNSVLLNVGTVDGVRRNNPVVNEDGLLGKVAEVGTSISQVQLLLDPNFRVAALDQRSRVQGILRWSEGITLKLEHVPNNEDIQIGDELISSGLGGLFPFGLRIGVVTFVQDDPKGIFKNIEVKPWVNFNTLEEVFVVDTVSIYNL